MYNFFIKVLSWFIFPKSERRSFRKKYYKPSKTDVIIKSIEKHIDKRFYQFINSFYTPNEIVNNDINLELVQKANNILLQAFKRICEANNIEYWLDWGTLLGAVRHGGFIPWDDDIDVSMTRKNIKLFEEAVKKERLSSVRNLLNKGCSKSFILSLNYSEDEYNKAEKELLNS